jgi:hypothetical protein
MSNCSCNGGMCHNTAFHVCMETVMTSCFDHLCEQELSLDMSRCKLTELFTTEAVSKGRKRLSIPSFPRSHSMNQRLELRTKQLNLRTILCCQCSTFADIPATVRIRTGAQQTVQCVRYD